MTGNQPATMSMRIYWRIERRAVWALLVGGALAGYGCASEEPGGAAGGSGFQQAGAGAAAGAGAFAQSAGAGSVMSGGMTGAGPVGSVMAGAAAMNGAQAMAGQGAMAGSRGGPGAGAAGSQGGPVAGAAADAGIAADEPDAAPTMSGDAGAGDAGTAPDAGSEAAASDADSESECSGRISYSLAMAPNPTPEQQDAYDRITEAMDTALSYYNCYTQLEKEVRVSYEPSVATADGNPNGSIRFGSTQSMNHITAMHEISHTLGVGDNVWDSMIVNGIFPGENATAQLRAITGDPSAEVHGDNQHFWPYGLNYVDEVMSEQDLIDHCLMVVAIRKDLGYD